MISNCKKLATHEFSNPTRCENHFTEDTIDLVQKMCSNCRLPNILIQDNKCADCNIYAEVKVRVRLAKQLQVKNILEENNIPYEAYDYCGRPGMLKKVLRLCHR